MDKRDISWISKEDAYQMGISTGEWMERERIIALLEKYENGECGFGVTHDLIALINGEN